MTKLTLLALGALTIGGAALADPPKPPPEMADMLRSMAGTWKCTGTDPKLAGTLTTKSDLDGYWGHDSFSGTMGAVTYRFESYMTYDPTAKKWRVMMMNNLGGSMVGTSDGMKDLKMEVDAEAHFKDHIDMTDLKKGVHRWGEESRDGGKTWTKVYDMTCKK